MAASENMFLYWGSGSAPCWMAMIVLEEKGLSGYGNKLVSFSAKEHKSDEIMKLNPRGQVPTFTHGDVILNESKGICHYLESQFKNQGTKLIPDGPSEQALVLQRMYESDNIVQKGIKNIAYYHMTTKEEDQDKKYLEEKYAELQTELEIWESHLSKDYLCGADLTMADVFFFPFFAFLVRGSLSLQGRPNLKRYYDRCISRPSIQKSWPPHWKDTPSGKIFVSV